MWLTGAMRRVAQDMGAFAPIHAGIGLSQRLWLRQASENAAGPATARPHPHPATLGAETCEIGDFEPSSDTLVCIWDDSADGGRAPKVRLEPDPEHKGWLRIRLGSAIVAKVHGKTALTTADLAVMPLSSARAMGLLPPDGTVLQ